MVSTTTSLFPASASERGRVLSLVTLCCVSMSIASARSRKFVHEFAQFVRAIIDSLLEINHSPIEEQEIFITFTHLKNRKAYKRDQNQIDFLQCSDDHVALPAIICEDYGFLNRMGGGAGSDVLEMLCCFTGRAGAS